MSHYQPYYYQPAQPPVSGLAVAGMVLGIVGAVFFWIPFFGAVLELLAVVFSAAGMHKVQTGNERGNGFAVTGLVLGLIFLAIHIVIVAVVMAGA